MAGTNWITAGGESWPGRDCGGKWMLDDGSPLEIHPGRIWILAGYGSRLDMDGCQEMDDNRWIPSRDGSWLDMDRDRIWMDDRRWIKRDG
jgi:hypothetical protein